jgi:hypothetical protein
MLGEYFVLLFSIPLIYVICRHPGMKKDALGSLRLMAILCLASTIATAVRSHRSGLAAQVQLAQDAAVFWHWIYSHYMHWPILCASLSLLLGLPGRVRSLYKHGPPFSAVGLGCGMRVAVFFLGIFLLPWVFAGGETRVTWALWALILIAEILALWMHWDIQQRLRKLDAVDAKEVVA